MSFSSLFQLQVYTIQPIFRITTSRHVSSRTFYRRHNDSTRGDAGRAARMESLPHQEEEAAFRPEGGRSPGGGGAVAAVSCGKGVHGRVASVQQPQTTDPNREGIQGGGVSDDARVLPSCPDPRLRAAGGGQTGDGELRRGVAAALAADAEGAVSLPSAGAGL